MNSNNRVNLRNGKKSTSELRQVKQVKEIDTMKSTELVNALKVKGLPVYGTMHQKRDRLKSHYGFETKPAGMNKVVSVNKKSIGKDSTRAAIDRINQNRETRRQKMEEKKLIKLQKEVVNQVQGIKWDVDFQLMVEYEKSKVTPPAPHSIPDLGKINICVRKRPIFHKEATKGEIDCVSWTNPAIIVHKCKYKVDGITKYIDNLGFEYDNTFSEFETSDSLYYSSIQPQIDFLFDGGIVTCFAYGQTGSGKTYTMEGVQKLAVNDFFAGAEIMREETGKLFTFTVAYYEIYNGKVFDLLDNHSQKKVQEDKNGCIQIPGLKEVQARTAEEMTQLIEYGLSERKTKSTAWNDTSSRSHAIGMVNIKEINSKNQVVADSGKLLLVDLAGSEKAQDSQSNIKQRRIEGAEINTSLLSLKECIRAMDAGKKHIPFRQSKLTMVLRDSFIGGKNKNHVIMIACISPTQSSSDHTCNTLRYGERLKCTTDDEETVEKYMHSKPIVGKSQELHYIYNEPIGDNTGIYDGDEDEIQMSNDPRLYQSQDYSSRAFEESEFIHYHEPEGDMDNEPVVASDNEPYREQEFEDASNFIELNPLSTEQEVKVEDYKKNYNENYHSQRHFDLDPPKYENKLHDYHHNQPVVSQINQKSNYDSNPRRSTGYAKHISSYRKIYTGQESEIENEDEIMEADSDDSDVHYSPQHYISTRKESSFALQMKLRDNAQSAKLDLMHSSSNSRLCSYKATEPRRMNYSKDKTRSSTSNITSSYLLRTKQTPKTELHVEEEKIEPLNKTSQDLSYRQKPISSTLSYRQKPMVQRTVESQPEQNDNTDSSFSDRYRNLVGQSSYGKAMVASYNSYFKHEREHIRPTKANTNY
jgi:hypothetical protein